eukprot:scaffold307_cov390-Prasinococcus_capsulatus_cf.AAC.42
MVRRFVESDSSILSSHWAKVGAPGADIAPRGAQAGTVLIFPLIGLFNTSTAYDVGALGLFACSPGTEGRWARRGGCKSEWRRARGRASETQCGEGPLKSPYESTRAGPAPRPAPPGAGAPERAGGRRAGARA